jgi:DNA-binding IclR family transcriptional regulator
MVVIARVESPGLLGFAVRVGYRRPLHVSASGRVLMAFQPDRVRERMLADTGEAADDDLARTLAEIRRAGCLAMDSVAITGVRDLSAPVLAHGAASAALTVPFVGGASARLSAEEALVLLRRTADRISHELEGTRLA